jgi:hypothetical protein
VLVRPTEGSTPPVAPAPPEVAAVLPEPAVAFDAVPPEVVPPAVVPPAFAGVPPAVVEPPVAAVEPVEVAAVPDAGEVTGAPVEVPALAAGGGAVAVTTPQVGVV